MQLPVCNAYSSRNLYLLILLIIVNCYCRLALVRLGISTQICEDQFRQLSLFSLSVNHYHSNGHAFLCVDPNISSRCIDLSCSSNCSVGFMSNIFCMIRIVAACTCCRISRQSCSNCIVACAMPSWDDDISDTVH